MLSAGVVVASRACSKDLHLAQQVSSTWRKHARLRVLKPATRSSWSRSKIEPWRLMICWRGVIFGSRSADRRHPPDRGIARGGDALRRVLVLYSIAILVVSMPRRVRVKLLYLFQSISYCALAQHGVSAASSRPSSPRVRWRDDTTRRWPCWGSSRRLPSPHWPAASCSPRGARDLDRFIAGITSASSDGRLTRPGSHQRWKRDASSRPRKSLQVGRPCLRFQVASMTPDRRQLVARARNLSTARWRGR